MNESLIRFGCDSLLSKQYQIHSPSNTHVQGI